MDLIKFCRYNVPFLFFFSFFLSFFFFEIPPSIIIMIQQFVSSLINVCGRAYIKAESHRDPYAHKSIIHIIHTILMRHMYSLSSLLTQCITRHRSEIRILWCNFIRPLVERIETAFYRKEFNIYATNTEKCMLYEPWHIGRCDVYNK